MRLKTTDAETIADVKALAEDKTLDVVQTAMSIITLPPVLDLITCGRYRGDLLKKFKLHLESMGDGSLSLFIRVSDDISFNTSYVDLRVQCFVKLIYRINDELNIQSKRNLRDEKVITLDMFHQEMNQLLDQPTQELDKALDELYSMLTERSDIVKNICNNWQVLSGFASLFRDFAYPSMTSEAKASQPSNSGLFSQTASHSASSNSSSITTSTATASISYQRSKR